MMLSNLWPRHNYLTSALIVSFAVLYVFAAHRIPYGRVDAFSFWNIRAIYMFYTDYQTAFTILSAAHPDYPPGLPMVIAGIWRLTGDTSPVIPVIVHGVVFVMLTLFYRRWWALLLVAVVAFDYASWQYADLPLALTLLVATVAYFRRSGFGVGIGLGLGVITKNEGALIALCVMSVWIIAERRIPFRALIALLPFFVLLIGHKLIVGAPNDVVGSTGILNRLLDGQRYVMIVPLVIKNLFSFGNGAILFVILGVLVYRLPVRATVPLVAAAMIWLGYVLIYIITPHDFIWHINTSYDRLLLHLFPMTVYVMAEAR